MGSCVGLISIVSVNRCVFTYQVCVDAVQFGLLCLSAMMLVCCARGACPSSTIFSNADKASLSQIHPRVDWDFCSDIVFKCLVVETVTAFYTEDGHKLVTFARPRR